MRRLLLVSLAVAAIGCKSSSEPLALSATDLNVSGNFGLVFAAGRPLPVLVGFTNTQEVDLVADTMAIGKDSTWVETSYYLVTVLADGSQSRGQTVSSGNYALAAGQINFTMVVGGTTTFPGSVSGTTLTLLFKGAKYEYAR